MSYTMAQQLEELVADRLGVFLKKSGSAVTGMPVAPPVDIRADSLGNPYHQQEVLDYLFKPHPEEYRGFIKGELHHGKVSVVYYRFKVGVQVCAQPENYLAGAMEVR